MERKIIIVLNQKIQLNHTVSIKSSRMNRSDTKTISAMVVPFFVCKQQRINIKFPLDSIYIKTYQIISATVSYASKKRREMIQTQ